MSAITEPSIPRERPPNEPPQSYAASSTYRDLARRHGSLAHACQRGILVQRGATA
jgi:hypothetical protein